MQVGLARGRARSVVGGTRCSWSKSAGPSLLDGIPVQGSGHSTRPVQRDGDASPWSSPRPASAEAVGTFHDSATLNLAKGGSVLH